MAKARKVEVVRGVGRFLDPHHLEVELTSGKGRATTGREEDDPLPEGDHRRRQPGGEAAVHAGRSARGRFHRRAAAAVDPEAHAGRRRRHHRSRNGHRVFDARHAHRRRRNAGRHDDRRRPRSRQGVGEEERRALRQRHAEDEDGVGGGDARRASRSGSKGAKAPAEAAGLRPGAGGGGPQRQRQGHRRRKGRRGGHRPRLHSASTSRCAPTSRTSTRSATSSASRCSRTRPCTRRMSRPRPRPGQRSCFDARQIPSVAYTDPEVAWAGLTEERVQGAGHQVRQGGLPVGRLGPRDRQRPRRRIHQAAVRRGDASLHRRRHRRHARRRPDRRSVPRRRDGLRPGRHRQDDPSASDALRESIGMAAELFEGVCTDLPPAKKR